MTMRSVLSTVLVCAWVVAAAAAELPARLVDPYLRIQTALAADKMDGVKQDAAEMARAAGEAGEAGRELATAASRLEAAADLKAARTAFGEVSETLVAFAKATGATNPQGVNVAFCPMARKPWLQKGDAIRNPYYGSEMLTCGEIKKP